MSHLQIEQLAQISEEYAAVQAAIARSLGDPSAPRHGHLQRARQNLETTYIIRLFVEFEGILRNVLLAHDPRSRVSREAYNRINRAARLFSIPDPIRDAVHAAREYRNSVVHPGGIAVTSLTFRQARSVLNRFLKPLP